MFQVLYIWYVSRVGELPYGSGSLQKVKYGAVGGQVVTSHVLSV